MWARSGQPLQIRSDFWNLPKEVQALVRNESISMGHARALLALKSAELMLEMSKKVISDGLSVRQVEEYDIVSASRAPSRAPAKGGGYPRLGRPSACPTCLQRWKSTTAGGEGGLSSGDYFVAESCRIIERLGVQSFTQRSGVVHDLLD